MKCFTFLLLFVSLNACATSSECTNQATQSELNICAGNKLSATEINLKKEIEYLSEFISDDGDFKKANELWMKYRDFHCSSISNIYSGGSIQHYIETKCKIALTEERIKILKTDYSETIDIITKGAP